MTTVESRAWTLPELAALADSSLQLILSLQDESGAYPASPTFSAYRGYSWFRDGAFIADSVSAVGAATSADRFHDWCTGILVSRGEAITRIVAGPPVPDAEMLPTRFTFAGEQGSDEWWDFQLDGYGTWLWAVAHHAQRHSLAFERWMPGVKLATDYLLSSWRRPCFDWWEESNTEVHVSTLGCIAAGLEAVRSSLDDTRADAVTAAVADIREVILDKGIADGHLAKWLGSAEVDASLLALVYPLDVFPPSSVVGAATIVSVEKQLTVGGGVHRYRGDTFFGGGQWPLLSCFLGLAYASAGDRERALEQLRWTAATANTWGELPEQVAAHLLHPSREQEWIERWGSVATPLLWSHAMYLRLAAELGVGNRP